MLIEDTVYICYMYLTVILRLVACRYHAVNIHAIFTLSIQCNLPMILREANTHHE